jgi:serine/threonine-protein kinase
VIELGAPTVPAAYPPESDSQRAAVVSNIELWDDSAVGLPNGPAAAFATNADEQTQDELPTIGHIGRYALKYRIGEGGLGTVYAAHDPLLSRLIAIKTLNLELSAEERESFNALFLNEARAAAGLSHPHIVTVFDAGTADNSAYIAMELLKGRDLRQLREEGWRPTPVQAALIARRVADALAYAHSKGVVHRDVKPANIFMVGRTQPRVLDFGIAHVAHRNDGMGDIAAGSPYYMAPEQARQEPVDRRADVFSLGVVLYEMLTDQKPFRGSTLAEISQSVIEHEPPPANEVNARVPHALAQIVAHAMLKDPQQRYRSALTLARELRQWLEENDTGAEAEPPARAVPRNWLVWAGGAAAAVVLGSVTLFFANSSRESASTPGAQPIDPPAGASVSIAAAPAAAEADSRMPAQPSAATLPAPGTPDAPTAAVANPAAATAGNPKPKVDPAAATAANPKAETAKPGSAAKTASREPRSAGAGSRAAAPAVKGLGVVRLAVSPWGQIEVNGEAAGTAPPLTELKLNAGKYQITIRNSDFPPFHTSVIVAPGQDVRVKHRFGS